MRCAGLAALTALLVWTAAEPASALTVTLNPATYHSAVNAEARDGGGTLVRGLQLPTAVPDSDIAVATQGGSSADTGWSLSHDSFQIVFDHTRAVAQDSYAQTYASLFFTVDEAVDYVLAGTYDAADATGRHVFLRTYLFDYTLNDHLFNNEQSSDATPDESFTLGQQGGDAFNLLDGSLTGTLAPGHDYQIFVRSYLENQGAATAAAATARGSITLSFVPEPASALLLGMGVLALGLARRRQRAA